MYKPFKTYHTNRTSKHVAYIVPTHLPVLNRFGLLDKNILSARLITEQVRCGKPNCHCVTQNKLHKRTVIRWRDFEGEKWVQHKKYVKYEDLEETTIEMNYIYGVRYLHQHYSPIGVLVLLGTYRFDEIVATGIGAREFIKLDKEYREEDKKLNELYGKYLK